jgi:hypothetical protein
MAPTERHPSELDHRLGRFLRDEFKEEEKAKTHSGSNSCSDLTLTQYICRFDLSSFIRSGHPQSPFRLLTGSRRRAQ